MDVEKKMKSLISENEFLQLELEDLSKMLRKKTEEIDLLSDNIDGEAILRSQIEIQQLEIDGLKRKLAEAEKSITDFEMMNEETEQHLFKEQKERRKDKTTIEQLTSFETEAALLNIDLKEIPILYKKIKSLKSENAQLHGEVEILKMEIRFLKEVKRT